MSSKLSNEQLVLTLKLIRDLKEQAKELDEQIETLQDSVKAHLLELGVESVNTGIYKVSWKPYIQNRLDTNKLKNEHGDLYQQYLKPVEVRRFLIS